jgi:hypothetical protein
MKLLGGSMKNQDTSNTKVSALARFRIIAGTLMAMTGVIVFTLSAMFGLIEATTLTLLLSLALFVGGLLLANSMKVTEFIQDIMLR